jgi:broad specificity phosphatase PhoE
MAGMGELVVIRHGQTEWSRSGQHTSVTDLPLLPEGEEQARHLQKSLAGRRFVEVWVSPRQRALRTAELAGMTPTRIVDDLVEVVGGRHRPRRHTGRDPGRRGGTG